jgi:hypothetical protein
MLDLAELNLSDVDQRCSIHVIRQNDFSVTFTSSKGSSSFRIDFENRVVTCLPLSALNWLRELTMSFVWVNHFEVNHAAYMQNDWRKWSNNARYSNSNYVKDAWVALQKHKNVAVSLTLSDQSQSLRERIHLYSNDLRVRKTVADARTVNAVSKAISMLVLEVDW